jgi:hypothetical protein
LSTFRCWETAGRLIGNSLASSPTARGPSASRSRIAWRVGSPSAVIISGPFVTTNGKLLLTLYTCQGSAAPAPRGSDLTAGTARKARAQTMPIALMPTNVLWVPRPAAIGPTTAVPIGMRIVLDR